MFFPEKYGFLHGLVSVTYLLTFFFFFFKYIIRSPRELLGLQ
jgi:hypothetical protein